MTLRDEVELLRGQLLALTGEPLPWPDDLPADLRPEAMDARLAEVAEQLDDEATYVDLDCAEYPCVLLVHQGEDAIADIDDVFAAFSEGWRYTYVTKSSMGADENGSFRREVHAFLGGHRPEGQDRRLEYRMKTLLESLTTP